MDENKPPIIDLGKSILDAPKESSSQFQLNPTSVIARNTSSEERLRERQIITALVGMMAVVAVIAFGQYFVQTRVQSVSVEAAVNMKRTLRGTVGSVDHGRETFALWYQESLDPRIQYANVMEWMVRLPPGTSFIGSDAVPQKECYVVTDIRKSLSEAQPTPCYAVVRTGQEVLVEYVVLQPEKETMVAKTIIGNSQ